MREFRVRGLGAAVENGVFSAALGDYTLPDEDVGQHIVLQAWAEGVPEGEDDEPCLVDEAQATVYGGVAAWGLRDRVLVISLNDKGKRVFEDDGWHLDLSGLTDTQVAEMEGWVARVLINVPRDDSLAGAPT
jgi:hypothetical protein